MDVADIFITCIKNISGCSMSPELENLNLMEMLPILIDWIAAFRSVFRPDFPAQRIEQ